MKTKFRFIALELDTKNVTGTDKYSTNLPIPAGLPTDVKNRLARIGNAVETAYGKINAATDDETLTIFTAPEFYFRPLNGKDLNKPTKETDKLLTPKANGRNTDVLRKHAQDTSYSFAMMQNIYSALIDMFSDHKFKNWLFLPGTIFSSLEVEDPKAPVYLNTLPIIAGAKEKIIKVKDIINSAQPKTLVTKDVNATVVQKKLISTIDGAYSRDSAYLNGSLKVILDKMEELQGHVMEIDGLKVGVEICLDHSFEVNVIEKGKTETKSTSLLNEIHAKDLDIQFLISCGMSVHDDHLVLKDGNPILRNDGSYVTSEIKRFKDKTSIDAKIKSFIDNNLRIYDPAPIHK